MFSLMEHGSPCVRCPGHFLCWAGNGQSVSICEVKGRDPGNCFPSCCSLLFPSVRLATSGLGFGMWTFRVCQGWPLRENFHGSVESQAELPLRWVSWVLSAGDSSSPTLGALLWPAQGQGSRFESGLIGLNMMLELPKVYTRG